MTYLHYGADVRISLDEVGTKRVVEGIAAHATRGGWVIVSDTTGLEWSFLITAGIPIWISQAE